MKYILILFCIVWGMQVYASETNGTILPSFKYTEVCHDTVCISGTPSTTPGKINFAPTLTNPADVLRVTDSGITGNAWGNELGWIDMNPQGSGVFINPTTGALSGFAWSQSSGWINFAPTGSGVTIGSDGSFSGFAWAAGPMGGWIPFNCSNGSRCIKTDWRPIPFRTTTTPLVSSGGGFTVTTTPADNASIALYGISFPGATVYFLENGIVRNTVTAEADGTFTITLPTEANFSSIFSMYAVRTDGMRTPMYAIPLVTKDGTRITVKNIFLAPILSPDKKSVKKGTPLVVSGYTAPNTKTTILLQTDRGETKSSKVITSDGTGLYTSSFDTGSYAFGTYILKSQSVTTAELTSPFSQIASVIVGTASIDVEDDRALRADVNKDGKIDLIDFSIVAFWYKRADPPTKVDLNDDRKVDLIDFSILAYYWTG